MLAVVIPLFVFSERENQHSFINFNAQDILLNFERNISLNCFVKCSVKSNDNF